MSKIVSFLKNNYLVFSFFIVGLSLEILGLIFTTKSVLMSEPYIFLLMMILVCIIMLSVRSEIARIYISLVWLLVILMFNIFFVYIFESTQTFFEYSFFSLRADGMGIIKSVQFNIWQVYTSFLLIIVYLLIGFNLRRKVKPSYIIEKLSYRFIMIILLFILLISTLLITSFTTTKKTYQEQLYGNSNNPYNKYGATANFVYEVFYNTFFNKIKLSNIDELESFIYNKVDKGSGMFDSLDTSNYNVISILVESLEWFVFLNDIAKYPNNLGLSDAVLKSLYPNFNRLMESSVVLENYYSRNKTDVSEVLSFVGSYPSKVSLNYRFSSNYIANSIPNTLKALDLEYKCIEYHNGDTYYYNRNVAYKAFGFDSFVGANEMVDFYDLTDLHKIGERNLDSEMMEKLKEDMFPLNEKFYTKIVTLTMHGEYNYRSSLAPYIDLLNSKGLSFNTIDEKNLFYYAACALDTDKAIGILLDYLEETKLIDNTVIVLLSDHNTYYGDMSAFVKNKRTITDNYTQLFNVPCMIKIPGVSPYIITKPTWVGDIVPTIFDILKINHYSNLYFGVSIFSEERSIHYSRNYNVYVDEKMYFSKFNRIIWKSSDVDNNYSEKIRILCEKFLEKLDYSDQIYFNDYFNIEVDGNKKYELYKEKMKLIN